MQRVFWTQYEKKTNIQVTVTFDEQLRTIADLKKRLEAIREESKASLIPVKELVGRFDCNLDSLDSAHNRELVDKFCSLMQTISRDCNKSMQEFSQRLVSEAFNMCGEKSYCPCQFEVIVIGSMAKGECTPYSDLEYLFLVQSTQNIDYFVLLAVTSYFLIGSLQETSLAHMDIQELKGKWYRDSNPAGFQIDGITSRSGNIPTGSAYPNQRNKFIKTVSEMVNYYQDIYDNPGNDADHGDLSAMLANTASIFKFGDEDFHSELKNKLEEIQPNAKRIRASTKMLRSDVKRHNFLPNESFDRIVDFKRQIYRYPSIMIHDLKIYFESKIRIKSSDSFQIAQTLLEENQISADLRRGLLYLLYAAQYIRLETYHYFGSQRDDVSLLTSSEDHCGSADSPYYPPRELIFHMFLYTIPVKALVSEALDQDNCAILNRQLRLESLECAALVHYYSSEFDKFLQCVKIMAPDGYANLCIEKKLMALEALRRSGHFEEVLDLVQRTKQSKLKKQDIGVCMLFEAHCDYELSKFADAVTKYEDAYDYFDDDHKSERARCYRGRGLSFLKLSKFSDGEACFEKELEIFKSMSDSEAEGQSYDVDIAGCYVNIAICQEGAGQYHVAEENYLEAKQMYWRLRGPNTNHREASMLHVSLGNLKMLTREFPEAMEHYTRALAIDKALHDNGEHADIARDYNNLGVVYVNLNKFQDARDCFQKSLDIHEKMHPGKALVEIACRYRNLATVDLRLGEFESAKKWYLISLKKYEEIYSTQPHPDVGDIYTGLAKLYYDTDNKKEAGEHYVLALDTYLKVYGPEKAHPKIASAYNNACYSFLEQQDYEKAEGYALKSLDLFRAVEKPSELDIANCYDTLAEVYEKAGKFSKAVENYEISIQQYEEALAGKPDRELARSYMKLGALLQSNVDQNQALCAELYQKSLDMYKEIFPDHPSHPDIVEVKSKLNSLNL